MLLLHLLLVGAIQGKMVVDYSKGMRHTPYDIYYTPYTRYTLFTLYTLYTLLYAVHAIYATCAIYAYNLNEINTDVGNSTIKPFSFIYAV